MWNLTGSITRRDEDFSSYLDIESYQAEQLPQKTYLKNLHNYSMAAINSSGFFLASRPIDENDNQEEIENSDFH